MIPIARDPTSGPDRGRYQVEAGRIAAVHRDKWVAFWLSMAVPGAGQLWAGRWSCLGYFAAVACLAATLPATVSWAALAALGLIAAEHAKRLVEWERWRGRDRSAVVRVRVSDRSGRGRRVVLRVEVEVARRADVVWSRVADLPGFVTIDPFHSRFILLDRELRQGSQIALEHRVLGVKFLRFGRLLRWREGRGYTFSDLSGRSGSRGFFPHVFDVAVEPDRSGIGTTLLIVEVRGRWTSRWLPRRVGLWWFRYVSREHGRLLGDAPF